MTTYQRMLKTTSILLVVLGIVMFAGTFLSGALITMLIGLSDGAIDADVSLAFSDEDREQLMLMLVMIPAMMSESILQIIAGSMGNRAARHPSKAKSGIVWLSIFLAVEVVSSIYYSAIGYLDAASILVTLVPILLAVLGIVAARNVSVGFQEGTVKDIKEIRGENYKSELGFIRVIQVLFLLNVCLSLVVCAMSASSSFTFSFSQVLDFLNLVLDGVGFYLIFLRSKAARFWIMGLSAFNIVAGVIYSLVSGEFNPTTQLLLSAWDIFLLLYFGLAKRPRIALNKSFDASYRKQLQLQAWDIWKPTTWEFWRNMIIYFCLFSIVGHWMEAGLCLFIKYGIVPGIYDPNSGIWRDYLSPFPVYGAGMVACGLLLYPIKTKLEEKLGGVWKPLLASFVVNTLVCAVIELILGFTSNQPVNGVYPLWDYSTMPFNFMGQICLQNTTAFGVVATLMTWAVWPALQRLSAKMPNDVRKTFFVAVVVFYAFVVCLYLLNLG